MSLTPQQISHFLKQAGFHSPHATKKNALWQSENSEPFYVNLTTDSGTSAIVIAPEWMARLATLQSIPGIVPGTAFYHSSNMVVFPRRKYRGEDLIHYGLPITIESERGLQALLDLLTSSDASHATTRVFADSENTSKVEPVSNYLELLAWFEQYTGKVLTWAQLQAAPDTVTISAKGIYKPKSCPYALSIRQTLDSPYSDQEPEYQDDGSWRYRYAQEEDKNVDSATLFTNQGLKRCMDDGMPVAVLRQLSKKPHVTRYRVLGLANVVAWEDSIFTLQSTTLASLNAVVETETTTESTDQLKGFDPQDVEDTRKKILREITTRQGQPAFRSGLLTAYEGRCAITGCAITHVLEAAHITPYLGPETNHISNGLLLRSDLHTLWDKGLIFLNDDYTLQLKTCLEVSEYAALSGKPIFLPALESLRPSIATIQAHRAWCETAN